MESQIGTDGVDVMYTAIELLCQTLVYGVYAVLIPFSTCILLRRGFRSRTNVLMFGLTIFMFSLATIYWGVSVASLLLKIHTAFMTLPPTGLQFGTTYGELFNAIILINYVLTDGVVVWRAWVLCKDTYSKILIVPSIFLILTIASVFTTIGIRTAIIVLEQHGEVVGSHSSLTRAIDRSQVANLVLSLLTNLLATSVISFKAWKHRQLIKDGLKKSRENKTLVERVFALLIESGIIYCFSGLTVLASTVIRLPHGTLGDIYTRVNVQLAGIYPTIILVLISMGRTMDDTTFCIVSDMTHTENQHRHMEAGTRISTIHFATRREGIDGSSSDSDSDDGSVREERTKESVDPPIKTA